MKIIVQKDDGTAQDITSLVQVAFDVATHSMDWGSGFLDIEETDGLILLAEACQFPALDEILQEQWSERMKQGKTYAELEQMAAERGVSWWGYVKPTTEEREQILNDMKRKYAPEETP